MEDMRADGITPVFEPLEEKPTQRAAQAAETRYVWKYAKLGHPLLNAWPWHREIIARVQKAGCINEG